MASAHVYAAAMKTILTSLTLALLLAPALQAGDHKKPAPSSEERRIQDAKKRLDETAQKINAAKSRAEFLKRFDRNRDGQVTRDETRATLAEQAKRRAAEREKAKQKK
jgi:hypothetical protein